MLKSFVNAGIPLALGSDGGVAEQNPFLNLMLAVLVPSDPSEALTREQALTAYTARWRLCGGSGPAQRTACAWFYRRSGCAFSRRFDCPDVSAARTTSLLTMVDGEVIFEDPALASTK